VNEDAAITAGSVTRSLENINRVLCDTRISLIQKVASGLLDGSEKIME
jgi:hypothetical protein